jgi:hypothetical protein
VIEGWNDLVRDIQQASEDEPDHSLVVAHANTLRALVMHLDDIPPEEIEDVNIGTALPFYYDIDKATGKRVVSSALAEHETQAPRVFRGVYIDDERKRRNFLERRRAANDPWLWALHDDQVSRSMLLGNGTAGTSQTESAAQVDGEPPVVLEGLEGLEEEAMHNTEVFAASLLKPAASVAIAHPERAEET